MIRPLWNFLTAMCPPRQLRQIYGLVIAVTLAALLQTLSIAAIMPFMAVVASPAVLESNRYLGRLYAVTGLTDPNQFLFVLGAAVLVAFVISNAFSAFTLWLLQRFSHALGHTLSARLFSHYLMQPYPFFVDRHSADLAKNILSETDRVTHGLLVPASLLLARCVSIASVLGLLILADPGAAATIFSSLLGSYGLIYLAVHRRLSRIGRRVQEATRERFRLTSEAFAAIKYLKLRGLEAEFAAGYTRHSRRKAECDATSHAIAELPKYLLEIVAFGGILALVLYLLHTRRGAADVLPLLGLYAFAGHRLIPQLQQVFASTAVMRYNRTALDTLIADMGRVRPEAESAPASDDAVPPLDCTELLEVRDLVFTHPNSDRPTLRGLNLAIRAGTFVGIAGSTGAGKTTLIDILLGLLEPGSGELLCDGIAITRTNVRAWQRHIGYVPQEITLLPGSVGANIAFGVPPERIDREALERAARIARLHDFVSGELPNGYDTLVGERGVRLSGGQRQRIGIARALYPNPRLLVLDEATSALDPVTEQGVLDGIAALVPAVTVILITHRMETLKCCDSIYLLEKGQIVGNGDFDTLARSSIRFRQLLREKDPAGTPATAADEQRTSTGAS